MTVEEIIALCHAGYNSDQIMQLAQAQQMERAQQVQQPQQPQQSVQQPTQPVQQPTQPVQPAQAVQPVQQPAQAVQPRGYEQIMSELLGLKQAVQEGNLMQAQQPAQIMTAEDIIANIIAPRPKKED